MTPPSAAGSSGRRGPGLLPVLLLLLFTSACEEGVDPIAESDRYFSLYGFMNMNSDTQWVRVEPVRPVLVQATDAPLDAQVVSMDLNTGEEVVWRDSVFLLDGAYAHVFYAPLRVLPQHSYRLTVTRSDGEESTVETTIPPRPVADLQPPRTSGSPPFVQGTQLVRWEGVQREPDSTAFWYRLSVTPGGPPVDLAMPPHAARLADEAWEATVNLSALRDTLVARGLENALLMGLGMRLVVRDLTWDPPGDRFDVPVLAQPGVFSNVENGFGFVGAAGTFTFQWVLDPKDAADLGFNLPGKR